MSAQPQSVQQHLSPVDLFSEFAQNGFTLRDPAPDVTGLHAVRAVGDCVEPLLTQGDVVYIDYTATPQHGDLVSFEWSRAVQESWAQDARRPAWIAKFGDADFARGIKLLWEFPRGEVPKQFRDDWLLTREDARRARDHKVLGVVRAVARNGRLLMRDIVHRDVLPMSSIDPNAATYTVINNNNSGGTGITGVTGISSLGFVVNPTSPPFDCTVIVTATIQARQTVGTLGQVRLLVRFADDSVTFVSSAQEVPINSASYQAYTMQWQFSHLASNAGHGQAGLYSDNTGPSTNSFDWEQATLQIEYIIR